MIPRACAGHIEEVALGLVDLLQVRFRNNVRGLIRASLKAENHVDDLLFTQFCDKAVIIRKSVNLGFSKSQLERDFDAFQDLRDKLAHANEYAATSDDAAGVAKTVQRLFEVQARIEEAKASALGKRGQAEDK